MSEKTHWRKLTNPNYLGAYAFQPGEEKVVTIKEVSYEVVQNQNGKEECIVCHFVEDIKPMILNKTNAKTLKKLFSQNDDDPKKCVGHKVVLYVVSVKVGGQQTTGIRIKEFSEEKCADCGQAILPKAGKTVAELIEISKRNCGKQLCLACMQKAAAEKEAKNG